MRSRSQPPATAPSVIASFAAGPGRWKWRMPLLFRSPSRRLLTACVSALVVSLFLPIVALAIGPSDQVISDATIKNAKAFTLYDTGVLSAGLNKANQVNLPAGTGTIIGGVRKGNTGYVTILTASHVATAGVTTFSVGQGYGANPYKLTFSLGATQTYTIPGSPGGLSTDVSVVLAQVALNKKNAGLFADLVKYKPTVTNPTVNPLLNATAKAPVGFTEIGYGSPGTYNPAIAIGGRNFPGYTFPRGAALVPGVIGVRRFQNNQALAYLNPVVTAYGGRLFYEPLTLFDALAPSNNKDPGGTALPGDSGGPLYTQMAKNPIEITVTRNGMPYDIPVTNTNSLSAILVSGLVLPVNATTGAVVVPSVEQAVPITSNIYNWLNPYIINPLSIPEPNSLVLLGLGCLGVVAYRLPRRIATRLGSALRRDGRRAA